MLASLLRGADPFKESRQGRLVSTYPSLEKLELEVTGINREGIESGMRMHLLWRQ